MTTTKKTPAKRVNTKTEGAKQPVVKPVEKLFFSRDESWLRFNQRVLEEAQDLTNPVLERVKFLAITASNQDEFVEIRVASFLQRIEDGYDQAQPPDEGGLRPQERLDRLSERIEAFGEAQYRCWNEQVIPAMEAEKIRVLGWNQLGDAARAYALKFFESEVDPLLTPVTIDPSHPFPRVLNKALCIALLLRHKRKGSAAAKANRALGVVTVPRSLPRGVSLPAAAGREHVRFRQALSEAQGGRLFAGKMV